MTIAYCATVQPSFGGLKSFNVGLTGALKVLADEGRFRLIVITHAKYETDFEIVKEHVVLFNQNHIVFENTGLPKMLTTLKVDFAIFPHNRIPLLKSATYKKICIFHDLLFWRFPERFSLLKRKSRSFFLSYAARNCDYSFSVSQFTADELSKFIPGHKSVVCYQAINLIDSNKELNSTISGIKGLTKPYFLFIGAQSFQKNLIALIKGFDILRNKGFDYQLVIAGGKGTADYEIQLLLKSIQHQEDLIFPGYVSEEQKINLIKNAVAFVFPSVYEGFGIPLLEAFQIGTPVISSDQSCLPEISAGSALETTPTPENLAKAMEQIATDPLLCKNLVEKGEKRVADFTWKQTAEIIFNALNS